MCVLYRGNKVDSLSNSGVVVIRNDITNVINDVVSTSSGYIIDNRPNRPLETLEMNVEINLGDGSFGRRSAGALGGLAFNSNSLTLASGLGMNVAIVSYGGWVAFQPPAPTNTVKNTVGTVVPMPLNDSHEPYRPDVVSQLNVGNGGISLAYSMIYTESNGNDYRLQNRI
jgi:hypothetical protein